MAMAAGDPLPYTEQIKRGAIMAKKNEKKDGRKDGRIERKFTFEGKRYSVYGKSDKELREKEFAKRKELEESKYKKAGKLTVGEYFDRWLEAKTGTVKETTIRTDRILLNRIRETVIDKAGTKFGDLMLTAVEVQNIRDLQKGLQKELHTKDKNNKPVIRKGMTTRATNDAVYLLKQVYKTAIDERAVIYNPVSVKPLKRTEEPARDTIHRALTMRETADFLKAANESHYYNLYVFLLNTGCRIGEAGSLMIGDVNADGVKVCRTITRTECGGYEIGKEAKTAAGRRMIPMNKDARAAWDDQRYINDELDGVVNIGVPVFRAPHGGLLKSANVNYDIKKYCNSIGLEPFTVHAFRDTFATRCVESKMDVTTLKEIMGHTDINMTLALYAHVMNERKKEQLKAVSFLSDSKPESSSEQIRKAL